MYNILYMLLYYIIVYYIISYYIIYIVLYYILCYIYIIYIYITLVCDAELAGRLHVHPGARQLLRGEELAQGAVLESAQQSQDQQPGQARPSQVDTHNLR